MRIRLGRPDWRSRTGCLILLLCLGGGVQDVGAQAMRGSATASVWISATVAPVRRLEGVGPLRVQRIVRDSLWVDVPIHLATNLPVQVHLRLAGHDTTWRAFVARPNAVPAPLGHREGVVVTSQALRGNPVSVVVPLLVVGRVPKRIADVLRTSLVVTLRDDGPTY